MSESEVHGAARLEVLRKQMRSGEVDTLIVAFTDMQGRLLGKRASAAAFLDGLVDHGAHFCTYLLGTDMEMNTPEGFRLTSWETGYGDWIASPDWETLRVLPWQDRTALVLCDVIVEATHEEVPVVAAHDPQAADRAGGRAGPHRSRPARSSSTTS